jgi:hypothetical protein
MDNLDNENMPKKCLTYECIKCNFKCSKQSNYNMHLTTGKHLRITNDNDKMPTVHQCICGKTYKYKSGLCKHKHNCNGITNDNITHADDIEIQSDTYQLSEPTQSVDISIVLELLKQNQEFKELIMEQSKQLAEQCNINQHQNTQLLEAVKNTGNTTNNTTNNNNNCNNKFNLNLFLNETCKDAITLDDFVKSFQVTRDDFIHTGNVGFIEGISTVIMNRFRDMDMHTRPLHCTDLKRETVYIKNADKWEKEDNHKTNLRKAVKGVANKNMKELWRWYNDNKPEVELIGTDECENYFKYYKAALGGCGKEEDLKFEDKIIKNVLKEVQIDKSTMTIQ